MLTIDKAIEILSCLLADRQDLEALDLGNAIQLGKEALKRVQLHRKDHHSSYPTLLPGEDSE